MQNGNLLASKAKVPGNCNMPYVLHNTILFHVLDGMFMAADYVLNDPIQGGQTILPEYRIRDCLATGGPDTVRFT